MLISSPFLSSATLGFKFSSGNLAEPDGDFFSPTVQAKIWLENQSGVQLYTMEIIPIVN